LTAALAYGQEYRTYDTALLFGIPNLGIGNFPIFGISDNFAGIGFKMPLGGYFIRPMVLFTLTSAEYNSTEGWVGEKETETGYGAVVDVIKHLRGDKIVVYCGLGGGFIQYIWETESAHAEGTDPSIDKTTDINYYIRALLGIEYMLRKNMGLGFEYQAAYTHWGSTDENGTKFESSGNSMGISVVARLLLTIYCF
jgi:opacity protein-like surface antigen